MSKAKKLIQLCESMQRDCRIWKAKDGKWYMFLADEEHGEEPDGQYYGPFSSQQGAEDELDKHSNPGGFSVDDSGKDKAPTKLARSSRSRW